MPGRSNQNGAPSASNPAISRPARECTRPSPNAGPSVSRVVCMLCPALPARPAIGTVRLSTGEFPGLRNQDFKHSLDLSFQPCLAFRPILAVLNFCVGPNHHPVN